MKQMKTPALLFLCAFLAAGCQQEADVSAKSSTAIATAAFADDTPADGNVIAVVNGINIPATRLFLYAGGEQIAEGERQAVINNIVTSELIAQAARKSGISENQQVREELAIAEQTVLGRAYVTDFFENNPVDEARINARYEELAKEAEGRQEYDVAHILVEDEEQAVALLEQIKKEPQEFAALAQQHSSDPGSATNGGKLGWITPQALVPEFAAAMTELAAGDIVEAPVQTNFGWHIIRVEGKRDIEVPPLTPQLRQRIEESERASLFSQHIEQLRANATIELR